MNCYSFSGRLGKDPELKTSDNGNNWTLLSVAVNTGREETIWWLCKAFGRQAELICQHLRKGEGLEIVGHFRPETWTNQEGYDEEKQIVYIDRFSFCPVSKQQAEGGGGGQQQGQPRPQQQSRGPRPQGQRTQQQRPSPQQRQTQQRPGPQQRPQPNRAQQQANINAGWPADDHLESEDLDF